MCNNTTITYLKIYQFYVYKKDGINHKRTKSPLKCIESAASVSRNIFLPKFKVLLKKVLFSTPVPVFMSSPSKYHTHQTYMTP